MHIAGWLTPRVANKRSILIAANLLLFFLLLAFLPFEPKINHGLALLCFIAILWFSEAMHVTVTALTVPVLAVLLNIFPAKQALSNFAHPIIFLFLGGFALAAALRGQGLDKALATKIIAISGGHLGRAIFMLLGTASLLSMWISNTATTAMMLPLMLGLLSCLKTTKTQNTVVFALLGLAYSASIGGIVTLVGSPPNAIAAAEMGIGFSAWSMHTLPVFAVLLPSMWLLLWLVLKPQLRQKISPQEAENFQMNRSRWFTLLIFLFTVTAWILSKPLSEMLGGIKSFDSLVAIFAIILLSAFRLLEWKQIEKNTEWGVLFLFGGGLTLSAALKETGASVFLADHMAAFLQSFPELGIFIGLAVFIVFLTEVASNTASAALLVPLFASLALPLGVDPLALVMMVGVAASCAFMLPVATPPNAIVYGSGKIDLKHFLKIGLILNLFCSLVIGIWAWW